MADDDIIEEATEAFRLAEENEEENRRCFLEDVQFTRLPYEYQWPADIRKSREAQQRPCLTIPRLGPIVRQVVNDARQNKPSIKVHPADDQADPETAEILNGLIRNIEYASDADVAYDTAVDNAVTGGFGYFRINIEYAHDDGFDQDIVIRRIADPLTVYGDPFSMAADSSDWNSAFVVEALPKKAFERKWKGADKVDWKMGDYAHLSAPWMDGEKVITAEYWTRDEVKRKIYALSTGEVIDEETLKANQDLFDGLGIGVLGSPREVPSFKVTQRILTGAEVLETNEWAGKYIPIIPVYGDEVVIEGKRYFRSLIGDAKDAQRMHNYWRSTTTEMVALAPKTPFIGQVGQFETDIAKWETANTEAHPFIEYDQVAGAPPPQRQPFAGVPAGALQEALNASDDIKAITGIYDASLGARSNETSGVAIRTRQMEGDVSTFHFIDNLARGIRHAGRVIIDLIPKVYSAPRVVRILGEDGAASTVKVNQEVEAQQQGPNGEMQKIARIYDLSAGKYDLTVKSGPSFTTRREEAAAQMIELIRAFPAAASVLGDLYAKNLDWPGADEIAKRLQALLPPQLQGQDPNAQQAQQAQMQAAQQMKQLADENAQLKAQLAAKQADAQLKAQENEIKAFDAQTDRIKVVHDMTKPTEAPRPAAPASGTQFAG